MTHTVALITELGGTHGRGVAAGAIQFVDRHDDLELTVIPISNGSARRRAYLAADAIVVMVTGDWLFNELPSDRPIINVSTRGTGFGFPSVVPDGDAIGLLAAKHFLRQGCTHFATLGNPDQFRRVAAFREAVFARDHVCLTCEKRDDRIVFPGHLPAARRPVGLFCVNDLVAVAAIQQARADGYRVPEDLAVIGADDDETLGYSVTPTLTTIDTAADVIGRRAFERIHAALHGQPLDPITEFIPPRGLVARGSTDFFAHDDQAIAQAMRTIRLKRGVGVTPDALADAAGIPRRTFDDRFSRAVGCTPAAEINRCRIERAQRLLRETAWPLQRIAHELAIEHTPQFSRWFKRQVGQTPGSYRRDPHTH